MLRKVMPVARRVLGKAHRLTLKMRWCYARALYGDYSAATLDDLREALNTLEEIEPTVRRLFGGAHPLTVDIEDDLRNVRVGLRAREMSGDA